MGAATAQAAESSAWRCGGHDRRRLGDAACAQGAHAGAHPLHSTAEPDECVKERLHVMLDSCCSSEHELGQTDRM